MKRYIQSVLFDYLFREYTPELIDQKSIRNTINSIAKSQSVINEINSQYPDLNLNTKSLLLNENILDPAYTNIRVQITHWYMFLNFYLLKVAIESPFIAHDGGIPATLQFSASRSRHPVLKTKYIENTFDEYADSFSKIWPQIKTNAINKSGLNMNVMWKIITTSTFHTFTKSINPNKIYGGTKDKHDGHTFVRRRHSNKYRKSTRNKRKHRHQTSKRKPPHTSKRRNIQNNYTHRRL